MNSSIKPYRETICLDCSDRKIKKSISGRCFEGPHFHYQKYQKNKAIEKAKIKPFKTPKVKSGIRGQKESESLSELIKQAETAFNKYIRNRDSNSEGIVRCISCDEEFKKSEIHAGHYLPAGNNASVRFDEINVNGQCVDCNINRLGNQANYRIGLIEKYGEEKVLELEQRAKQPFKWDVERLKEIIKTYKKINKK